MSIYHLQKFIRKCAVYAANKKILFSIVKFDRYMCTCFIHTYNFSNTEESQKRWFMGRLMNIFFLFRLLSVLVHHPLLFIISLLDIYFPDIPNLEMALFTISHIDVFSPTTQSLPPLSLWSTTSSSLLSKKVLALEFVCIILTLGLWCLRSFCFVDGGLRCI